MTRGCELYAAHDGHLQVGEVESIELLGKGVDGASVVLPDECLHVSAHVEQLPGHQQIVLPVHKELTGGQLSHTHNYEHKLHAVLIPASIPAGTHTDVHKCTQICPCI